MSFGHRILFVFVNFSRYSDKSFHCRSIGVNEVVQDSNGNAGNSVAAYCAKAGIKSEIYVPGNTSPKKIDMIKAHGADVHMERLRTV